MSIGKNLEFEDCRFKAADGVCIQLHGAQSFYMGFYAEGLFDLANMQTGNYVSFQKV